MIKKQESAWNSALSLHFPGKKEKADEKEKFSLYFMHMHDAGLNTGIRICCRE